MVVAKAVDASTGRLPQKDDTLKISFGVVKGEGKVLNKAGNIWYVLIS